jgi:adenosylmethionine-8-amino-7-oxononanoate aminotransferase
MAMTATHTTGAPPVSEMSSLQHSVDLNAEAALDKAGLQRNLREHLLLNFTNMGRYSDSDVPVFVRGEGCYIYDSDGRKFIDGLSGLFCTNLGHSFGEEVGEVAKQQLSELVYTPTWTVAHPSAIKLAEKIASKAPEGMEHVFFTNSGSEAVESAWKLAREWHWANGEPQRTKAIARRYAYHGTTMGAMSFTGYAFAREKFEPLAVPTHHVSPTYAFRHHLGHDEEALTAYLLEEIETVLEFTGPSTVAMLIAEPVQNSGGSIMPPKGYWQGLRDICDKYGILLVADEVITGFGRVGHWFASQRFDVVPDMITFAKGVTAGHAPLGGVILNEKTAEPFTSGKTMFTHGNTWSGHPLSTAIGLKVLEIIERENIMENVLANEILIGARLDDMRSLPFVGDVRGAGHFWAIELVKDKETNEPFTEEEADWVLRTVLSDEMARRGLLCRLDDRDQPVIQISPPLIADMALINEILDIITAALTHVEATIKAGRPS